jgi:tetratricopeptide (TPR) repeat protein
MLSLLIALASALAVGVLFKVTVINSYWGVVPPSLIALVVVAALLFRRAAAKLEPVLKGVEKHIVGGRRELALKLLRDSLVLGRWHPLLPGQLRVQLGALEYAAGNLDAAEAELAKASRYPWLSRAYLGCVYFRKHDAERMKKAFETAIKVGDKEGIAYTLYAYCLVAQGSRDLAAGVIERGLKKLPGDHRLQANLELVKEGKKLKTAPYGDAWTRFGLDGGGALTPTVGPQGRELPKFARGFNPRPGFRQRPKRK